jgi:hypothetical protein
MSGPMRWFAWLFFVALAAGVAAPAAAASRACPDCFFGVYDDAQMTRSTGAVARFEVKSIYLGIRLPDGVGITALTFGATYPDGFIVLDYYSYVDGAVFRPGDASVTVEWPRCIRGSQLLVRLQLFTLGTVRDAVLQLRDAAGAGCDGVTGDRWLLPAGCYVANPTGQAGCAVGVRAATWAGMKALFK